MRSSFNWSIIFSLCTVFSLVACGESSPPESHSSTSSAPAATQAPPNSLTLLFTYGSEKEKWLQDVTQSFNAAKKTISDGKVIHIEAVPMGSGESIEDLLTEQKKAHITSPASEAFIKIGNARSQVQKGKPLIGQTENLVVSPVVIAMWKPMAEALGWGKKPIGWADIIELTKNPKGWAAHNHPEWGKFKLGHTHPEYSNSGLIAVFAQVYAATGKLNGLSLDDVKKTNVGEYLNAIQQSIVHYGRSTGFFADKLFTQGPAYLSAAVLYENNVIESYSKNTTLPIVAIYPKEGTFWSDHPIGVVERDWVTPAHREAAKIYIAYLLETAQQEKAVQYGFRPGNPNVPTGAPLDLAHGVDPNEPKTTLEVPTTEVMDGILTLWKQHKKHSNVVMVLDISGSMKEDDKIGFARQGALAMLEMLSDVDYISLLPFNNELLWSAQNAKVGEARENLKKTLSNLYAGGGTALYRSIDEAHRFLKNNPRPDKISAIVVLSDGADTDNSLTLEQLLTNIRASNEAAGGIRIFTIAYGKGADLQILKKIADATQARAYSGTTDNINQIFREIATFF